MQLRSIQMNNGKVFEGKKIGELTEFIINKFSDEQLTCDEAKIVLNQVEDIVGEYSLVKNVKLMKAETPISDGVRKAVQSAIRDTGAKVE